MPLASQKRVWGVSRLVAIGHNRTSRLARLVEPVGAISRNRSSRLARFVAIGRAGWRNRATPKIRCKTQKKPDS